MTLIIPTVIKQKLTRILKLIIRYFMTSSLPKQKYSPNKLPLLWMMLTGGLAGSIAEIATIPLDTAKVRMQLQGQAGQAVKYQGMLHCIKTIVAQQGASSLFQGLSAGLQRQMVFASLRIGLYDPVKNFIVGDKYQGKMIPLGYRIVAALATGAIGICVANPTDVVKVRFQADGRLPKEQRRYTGVMNAYSSIIKNDGVSGLWRGLVPNIFRNSIINAAEIATFDQVKDLFLHHKIFNDNIGCHIVSSSIAGFVAAVVGSPVDVLKTRIMNAKPGEYSGLLDCIWKTMKEGPKAFYKGFVANASRIVTWNVVMFVSLGQIRKFVYENSYKGIQA